MTKQSVSTQQTPERWGDDVMAWVSGSADPSTRRRVLAAAMTDKGLRSRLAFAMAEDEESFEEPASANLQQRAADLRERMHQVTMQLATKPQFDLAGTMQQFGAAVTRAANALSDRVLTVGRELITLPCLAPAMAAPGPLDFLTVQSQSVTTGEGVRIEFQQLPPVGWEMTTKPHLRIVVDASALEEPFGGETGYNTAFVTLEEGNPAPTLPDLHTLVIPLNAQGLGFTDANALPPPKAACRLVAVTLSHVVS
jgi:hypothetical protein